MIDYSVPGSLIDITHITRTLWHTYYYLKACFTDEKTELRKAYITHHRPSKWWS